MQYFTDLTGKTGEKGEEIKKKNNNKNPRRHRQPSGGYQRDMGVVVGGRRG